MELAYEYLAEVEGAAPEVAGLEEALRSMHQRGRQAWPGVELAADAFARHLGGLWSPRHTALTALHAEDVYLACACAEGDPRALQALDPLLKAACGNLPAGTASVSDEVRQLLREKLLVAHGDEAPQIAGYSGEGPLGTWLRVIAVRTALGQRKKSVREVGLEEVQFDAADSGQPDLELDYLKLRHGEDFRAAFRDAAQALSPRDRTVMRLYYVDGLGVEKLGAMYQVHASTVSRWLATTRETLLIETRRLLGERLKLTSSEVESLLGILRSRMQASLRKVLG